MGRHGGKKRRFNPLIIGLSVAALVLVVGLGWWWWSLRTATDPVSADPVQAYATVTDSGPCTTAGSMTTVDMNTESGIVSANLKICGYRVDQSILVEYLRSDPTQARVYGTSTAPPSSFVQKLLPIAILLLGVIAAGAALAMLRERRKPRSTANPITVAELRAARLNAPAATDPALSASTSDPVMQTVAPEAETEIGTPSAARAADHGQYAPAAGTEPAPGSPEQGNDVAAQQVNLTKSATPVSAATGYDDDLFGTGEHSGPQGR